MACCLTASHRAVLIETNRSAGFLNSADDPVVKLQPGADGHHDVGVFRHGVGSRHADHSERSGVVRMVVHEGASAGQRFDDGMPRARRTG